MDITIAPKMSICVMKGEPWVTGGGGLLNKRD